MELTAKQKRAPNDFKTAWRNMTNKQRAEALDWLADEGGGLLETKRDRQGRPTGAEVATLHRLRLAGSYK